MSEEKTIETIRNYANRFNNTFVNFSGGMYSLVLLHLALRALGEVKAIYVDTTIAFPECTNYVKDICEELGADLTIIERKDINFWGFVKRRGFPHLRARWCMWEFKFVPLRLFNYSVGSNCLHLTGTTIGNSTERKKIYEVRGEYHFNYSTASYVLHPILNWDEEMAKRYIRKNGLTINPCYALYDQSGCYYCPYIRKEEYYIKLSKLKPKLFQNIVDAEITTSNNAAAIYLGKGKRLYISKLVDP